MYTGEGLAAETTMSKIWIEQREGGGEAKRTISILQQGEKGKAVGWQYCRERVWIGWINDHKLYLVGTPEIQARRIQRMNRLLENCQSHEPQDDHRCLQQQIMLPSYRILHPLCRLIREIKFEEQCIQQYHLP